MAQINNQTLAFHVGDIVKIANFWIEDIIGRQGKIVKISSELPTMYWVYFKNPLPWILVPAAYAYNKPEETHLYPFGEKHLMPGGSLIGSNL